MCDEDMNLQLTTNIETGIDDSDNDNDNDTHESASTQTQTSDNDTDSDEELIIPDDVLDQLERLKKLLAIQEEEQEKEWNPQLEFSSDYIGNGFVDISITQCNSTIGQFELKYCFQNAIDKNKTEISQLSFQTVQFSPRKMDRNTLLIRVPQRITDYYFTFQFRGYAQQPQTSNAKWTQYSKEICIFIPFDAPQYQFKIGEIVHFQQPNNPFWSLGKITEISDENIADILYKLENKKEETFKISVDNLKFKQRYRSKLIDLTDWMCLSKELMLSGRHENIQTTFVVLHNILQININKWLFVSNNENELEPERMSLIDLIYFGDIEQDIACCSRFIALNVVMFLDENINRNVCGKNNCNEYDIIDNNISIGCGLCPIQSHYKTKSKLRNLWHGKMLSYAEYAKVNENMQFDFINMLATGVGTMCDICLIGFHHMSYLYSCSTSLDKQHDICLPCMNRNVLQYKRLKKTLNDLYFIHELDHYCISQIVYCLVGWVSLT